MEITKRKTIKLASALGVMLVSLLLAIAIIFAPNLLQARAMDGGHNDYGTSPFNYEEILEDAFVDNVVTVTLTKEATRLFLCYTPANFPEVGAVLVEDLTAFTVDWVRKHLDQVYS